MAMKGVAGPARQAQACHWRRLLIRAGSSNSSAACWTRPVALYGAATARHHQRGQDTKRPLSLTRASSSHAVPSTSGDHVTTPHGGYHFDGSRRRFFEGWYWKVTIPENGESFALIYSIEDPAQKDSKTSGLGIQVMGPGDSYICQYSKNIDAFWADRNRLALGAVLKPNKPHDASTVRKKLMSERDFSGTVELGFQASSTVQQGSIVAAEEGTSGAPMSTVESASWELRIKPIYGWGQVTSTQQATAGWLSVLSIFEPHWQVLMAHGLASGWLQWGNDRYDFKDAPTYAEKNWGGGFPSKWAWAQCNTFDGHPDVSITAVAARRGLLVGINDVEEDVGMLGIHCNGEFIELVPWNGQVEWQVEPWGNWRIRARTSKHEAIFEATTKAEGQILRAPTSQMGLAPYCKDTFFGACRLRVWELDSVGLKRQIVDATSNTAALEVGGGPWWSDWSACADMKEPLRSLVKIPVDVGGWSQRAPSVLKPPGL